MEEKKPVISNGKAEAFLICDLSFEMSDPPFFGWLKNEGFRYAWYHGNFGCCPWIFVNITRKEYACGMPGVKITEPIGNHAITIGEFMTIYSIYKKYEGKELFTFHSERFDYDKTEKGRKQES